MILSNFMDSGQVIDATSRIGQNDITNETLHTGLNWHVGPGRQRVEDGGAEGEGRCRFDHFALWVSIVLL